MAAAVSTVFLVLASLLTALRCYCRFIMVRRPSFDDILVVLALIASVGLTACIWEEQRFGLGQDMDTLTLDELTNFLKSFWASVICYCVSLAVVKCSAIFQCLRFILIGRMRVFCWSLIGALTVFGLLSILINIFHCYPVSNFWDITSTTGKCIDVMPYWYFAAGFSALTDIIVVAVPICTVKDMNLPRRQKLALILVFAFGIFACIAAVVRIPTIVELANTPNFTKSNQRAALWSSLEVNVGIICVCIPPLKPLIVAIAPSLLTDNSHDGSNTELSLSGITLAGSKRGTYSDIEHCDGLQKDMLNK